jgi:hypothetical protein
VSNMKIYTKIVWDMESLNIVSADSYEYDGPVELFCGASKEEKAAFANLQKVSNVMNTAFQDYYGKNNALMDEITRNLTPIQAAGPSQFGLSPAEEAAERTMTAEQMSQAGAQASNAVRSALASRGGGTAYLPSGSEASILGSLAQDTAVKEALAQAGITQRGYDIGRENWKFATKGLEEAPSAFEAPVIEAGRAATGAAEGEMQGGEAITQANQAWMAPVGQIVGGVAGGLVSPGGLLNKPASSGTAAGNPPH